MALEEVVRSRPRGIFVFALLMAAMLCAAVAQEKSLRVVLAGQEPFVSESNGIFSGLAVEIWEQVATKNQWTFTYERLPDVDDAVAAVAAGKADVVVGDAGITSERVAKVDFSQPYFRSGLQIMITDARPHTVGRLWDDLVSWGHVTIFWIALLIVVALSFFVMLFERKHNPDFPKTWKDGYAEAFYYVISLALTGKSVYKGFPGVLGRLMLVVWMILGVIMVAFVTSSITSAMTIEKLNARINGPADLQGKKAGAVEDTSGALYLKDHNITQHLYPDLPTAAKALVAEEIEAIVDDAPVLQYYDYSNPKMPITEVGSVFQPENYGFAVTPGSHLRQPINAALLKLAEEGVVLSLAREYLGPIYQP